MHQSFVTLRSYSHVNELSVVRSLLESEDIPVFLKDEYTSSTYHVPSIVGGIKLQVHESDVDRAVTLLIERGYMTQKDLEPSDFYLKLTRFLSRIPIIKNIYK